jgi:hypothetical protein
LSMVRVRGSRRHVGASQLPASRLETTHARARVRGSRRRRRCGWARRSSPCVNGTSHNLGDRYAAGVVMQSDSATAAIPAHIKGGKTDRVASPLLVRLTAVSLTNQRPNFRFPGVARRSLMTLHDRCPPAEGQSVRFDLDVHIICLRQATLERFRFVAVKPLLRYRSEMHCGLRVCERLHL